MEKWKTFYFDGNLAFGLVESRKDWLRIVKGYESHWQYKKRALKVLKTAKSCQGSFKKLSGHEGFGFYSEYRDLPTLGQWADQNIINLETAFWPRLITNLKFLIRGIRKYFFRGIY